MTYLPVLPNPSVTVIHPPDTTGATFDAGLGGHATGTGAYIPSSSPINS